MPVLIREGLDCYQELKALGAMDKASAKADLKIGILNLMPTVKETERQLAKALNLNGLYIEPIWTELCSRPITRVDSSYKESNYINFKELDLDSIDGFIVTGAPVELMDFEDVSYWSEITDIFDTLKSKSIKILAICWAAQALIYHRYSLNKYTLEKKCFGIFTHKPLVKELQSPKSFYHLPHSRHTGWDIAELEGISDISILLKSQNDEVFAIENTEGDLCFVGHCEYDIHTLPGEYFRDLEKGEPIEIPLGYRLMGQSLVTNHNWELEREILFGYFVQKIKGGS